MKSFAIRSAAWTALALCLVFATAASATPVLNGGTVPGAPLIPLSPAYPGGPFLADTMIQSFTTPSGLLSGTTREVVFTDTVTGGLDFVYAISNNFPPASVDGLVRSTLANFTGFTTDVGYDPTTVPNLLGLTGTILPTTIDRSLGGDTIGFNFGLIGFPPGTSTFNLVIETNATMFGSGLLSFIDGGTATVNGFAPTMTPEPASMLLYGTGIFLIGGILRRRLV
jgi:hypothetical protein